MVNIIVKSLVKVGTKLLLAMGSEEAIKFAVFYAAEKVTESTKTTADDKWLEIVKDKYE